MNKLRNLKRRSYPKKVGTGIRTSRLPSNKKVAALFDPGGPATEPRAKRRAQPSYFRRNLSLFINFQTKKGVRLHFAYFRRKLSIFKKGGASSSLIFVENDEFSKKECTSNSNMFVENCPFSKMERASILHISVENCPFSEKECASISHLFVENRSFK